ncbi:MAG: hypothetical protein ABIU96_02005 [Rhodanobacter sp.]
MVNKLVDRSSYDEQDERDEELMARTDIARKNIQAVYRKLSKEDLVLVLELHLCFREVIENSCARAIQCLSEFVDEIPKVRAAVILQQAKRGAMQRIFNDRDGKQKAKAETFMLWKDWHSGKTLHKSGAAFARFARTQHPEIESPTTVERWVRKWAAEYERNSH